MRADADVSIELREVAKDPGLSVAGKMAVARRARVAWEDPGWVDVDGEEESGWVVLC